MTETFAYGDIKIHYEVCFTPNRRTLAIEVHPNSRVLVRAPVGCAEHLIAERVQKRARWISRQLAEFERYRPRTPPRQYISGETHLYLGRQYRLKLLSGSKSSVKLSRGRLLVTLPGNPGPDRVQLLLDRWYRARARAIFTPIIETSLKYFGGIAAPHLVVRRMRSRWGSLSPRRTMTLNLKLIQAPRPCIEYVIVHELCHTRYRDHDAQFFGLLGRIMPDWLERKRRLEEALL